MDNSMDINTDKSNQVLLKLKDKHKQMDSLMAFTKEISNVFDTNNLEPLGTVLAKRQEVMDKIDKINLDVKRLISGMTPQYGARMKKILAPKANITKFNTPLEKNIFDTNKMTLAQLQKIIVLDKEANKKMKKGV